MIEVLKSIGKGVLSALLTEKFVKEIIIYLLEKLAKKSDNKIDDEIVAKIKEAMDIKDKKSPDSK
jgi:hypothetical protein|tara:strand:- start:906 stop:1100 length:195 start_codon:yes stop_codon:yes gene_type:complete